MVATDPALLIPNFRDRQQEVFAKSVKAVTDHMRTSLASAASQTSVQGVKTSVAALQAQLDALQAVVDALPQAQTYSASEDIAAGQAVNEVSEGIVALADSSAFSTCNAVVGIASAAASAGATVSVATYGETVTNYAWSWDVGAVYLSVAGSLTQTPPASGQQVQVGYAVDATTVFVGPDAFEPGPMVFSEVFSGMPRTVPYYAEALSPDGEGMLLNDALLLQGPLILDAEPTSNHQFFVQDTEPGFTQVPSLWLQTNAYADPNILVPWVYY